MRLHPKRFNLALMILLPALAVALSLSAGCASLGQMFGNKATPAEKVSALSKTMTAANDTFAVWIKDGVVTDPKVIAAYNTEQADIQSSIHILQTYAETGDSTRFEDVYPQVLGKITELLARYAIKHSPTTSTARGGELNNTRHVGSTIEWADLYVPKRGTWVARWATMDRCIGVAA